jgi:Domain of unknown function (DUF4290)
LNKAFATPEENNRHDRSLCSRANAANYLMNMSQNNDTINAILDFQPYNSQRPDMIIPEYGRNIQKMVQYAITLEDREERNQCCRAILSVMGQLFPHLRDIEDYNHKLWDHLHIMSNFKLEVDSPYPKPSEAELDKAPEKVPYPEGEVRFLHYGRYVERMITKCAEMEDGEEKERSPWPLPT